MRNFSSVADRPSKKSYHLFIFGGLSTTIIALMIVTSVFLMPKTFVKAQQSPAVETPTQRTIGINPSGVVSYDLDRPFADVMKSARPHWDTADGLGDAKALEDTNGWPTTDASIVIWEGIPRNDGVYQLSFHGQATVSVSYGYGTVSNQTYDAASNTTTAFITITDTGPENCSLIFRQTKRTVTSDTNTGVTDVRLLRPTSEGATTSVSPSETFNPVFKQLLSRFAVLRFMDWNGTNFSSQVNWSDRKSPADWNQTSPTAWEYAIQLANETGKDIYVNIPHKATGSDPADTSSYIYQFAKLIRDGDTVNGVTYAGLNPNLHVYIEWSNEVWNFAFGQAHDNYDAAVAEVNAGNSPLNYDGSTNSYEWGFRRIAKRIKETSDIFRSVFGDAQMMTRIRPVFEFQYDNAQDTAHIGLSFLDAYYNNADVVPHVSNPHPVNYYLWGAGGASYFGGSHDDATTVNGIFTDQIPNATYVHNVQVEAAWSKAFGLQTVAYEGGWAVGGDTPNSTQAAARFDPRAKQALLDAQNEFDQAGGDVNILFYLTGSNRGFTDDVYNQSTPLLQAVDQLNQGSPTPATLGTVVSSTGGTNIATSPDTLNGDFSRPNTRSNAYYVLRVNQAGTYNLSLTTNSASGAEPGQVQLFVNNQPVGGVTSVSSSSTFSLGSFELQSGFNTLHLLSVRGSFDPAFPNDVFHYIWLPATLTLAPGTTSTTPSPTGLTPTPSSGWAHCADEGGTCVVSGTEVVRYGKNGQYAYQAATNSIGCNNGVFGDPIPGTVKSCESASVPPSGWTKCADEGGTCGVSGTTTVAYGASGTFVYRTVTGNIGCNNGTFGDPIPGTFKGCYYN